MYTILALILALLAGYAIVRPLNSLDPGDDETEPLLALAADAEVEAEAGTEVVAARPAEKETIYATLAELEYDYATNKLSKEDYEGLKTELETQALALIKREEAIEAEILREVEADGGGDAVDVAYCPECGIELLKGGQKFCHRCGAPLPAAKAPRKAEG
ncbi:MAG: zinc ribbon domain-containing protein [Bacillota bacterium]